MKAAEPHRMRDSAVPVNQFYSLTERNSRNATLLLEQNAAFMLENPNT